eukprot:920125-Prymnesium_polylepis.2
MAQRQLVPDVPEGMNVPDVSHNDPLAQELGRRRGRREPELHFERSDPQLPGLGLRPRNCALCPFVHEVSVQLVVIQVKGTIEVGEDGLKRAQHQSHRRPWIETSDAALERPPCGGSPLRRKLHWRAGAKQLSESVEGASGLKSCITPQHKHMLHTPSPHGNKDEIKIIGVLTAQLHEEGLAARTAANGVNKVTENNRCTPKVDLTKVELKHLAGERRAWIQRVGLDARLGSVADAWNSIVCQNANCLRTVAHGSVLGATVLQIDDIGPRGVRLLDQRRARVKGDERNRPTLMSYHE